jgi:hypothetical protein
MRWVPSGGPDAHMASLNAGHSRRTIIGGSWSKLKLLLRKATQKFRYWGSAYIERLRPMTYSRRPPEVWRELVVLTDFG